MLKEAFESSNCIHIKPVKRTQEEIEILTEKVGINIYEAKSQFRWHEIDGKFYHFKFTDRFFLILNELIGPKIARRLNLKTANNILAIMDYSEKTYLYGILSENFKDKDKQYIDMNDLGFKNKRYVNYNSYYRNIIKLKRYCKKENYKDLIDSIFKMTCLDYIMGQADRVPENFLFEKDNDYIIFAPLFDYGEAYESIKEGCIYDKYRHPDLPFSVANSFITIAMWEPKFKRFLRKYPNFQRYLETVCKIDIIEILEEIEEEHQLKINEEIKRYYDVRTKEKQKILF